MITKLGKLTAKKIVDAIKNSTLGALERRRYPLEEQLGELTYSERKELEKKLLRPGTKLDRDRSVTDVKSYSTGSPGSGSGLVAGPGTSYTYAHELAHLSSPFGGVGQGSKPLRGTAHSIAYALGSRGMPLSALASSAGGPAELVGRAAVLGGTAAMLAEEAQASIRAVKAIREVKGDKAAREAAKKLGNYYATYVTAAAGSNDLMPRLIHGIRHEHSDGILDFAKLIH